MSTLLTIAAFLLLPIIIMAIPALLTQNMHLDRKDET